MQESRKLQNSPIVAGPHARRSQPGERSPTADPLAFSASAAYHCQHFVVTRISMLTRISTLAILLAALSLGAAKAHAQTNPLTYWTPGWPLGFNGNVALVEGAESYGNFPGFDGGRSGLAYSRYNFSNGFFVGNEAGMGLSGL